MKIGIIVRKLNVRGGVQRHVLSLAQEYKKLGHQVKLYTFIYSPRDSYEDLLKGLEVVALGFLPQPTSFKFGGYFNYFIGLLRQAAASKKLALLIDRDTEILNPHDHAAYKVAYFFKKRVRNIPSVWMIHDLPTKIFSFRREQAINPNYRLNQLKKFFYQLVDKYDSAKYVKVQDRIAVLGQREQNWVKEEFGKEAALVRNGLSLEYFPFQKRESPRGKQCRLLMNGIFMPHRRFEDGLLALQLLTHRGYKAQLSIVGSYDPDDSYFKHVMNLVHNRGLKDRVKFYGEVSETELVRHYAEHDIFLFPNHLQSWGLAVFEAMATGLPVIVSKSAGASAVLTDRENALLVEPKSAAAIAQSIQELIANPILYLDLSRNGRKFVEANISWGKLANDMIKIFRSMIPIRD